MFRVGSLVGIVCLASVAVAGGQTIATPTHTSFPRVIRIAGTLPKPAGEPSITETITFAIYADETGGTPLWQETQTVIVDRAGAYNALLGATVPEGLPVDLFTNQDARWLSIHPERAGQVDPPRVLIASVAYALRAADADTLGGRPASAYVLVDPPAGAPRAADAGASRPTVKTNSLSSTATIGTPGRLGLFVDAANLGDSVVAQSGTRIGVGTAAPLDYLHIAFNDPFGAFTGLAVQNLSGNANAASGMLFYDQNGALTQFQGFNNANHAYVINNIAKNLSSQFDGSYNFLIGSQSKLFVASTGNIGVGTTSPSALLEVSNAVSGVPANMWVTSYTNAVGPYYLARRARGTQAAPTAAQTGDSLSGLFGEGYGATHFGPSFTGGISVQAAQNFTDTAQGTALVFSTTSINATSASTRMTLDATGNLGIGTTTTPAAGVLEVSNAASGIGFGSVVSTSYSNTAAPLFVGRRARGTVGGPGAVQSGDNLGAYLAQGFGTSGFSGTRAGMFVIAAENWTDAAQGTRLDFHTTATGTNTPGTKMTIDPTGNVGIGTTSPSSANALEILRTGTDAQLAVRAYSGEAGVFLVSGGGTAAAPTAVQTGNTLGFVALGGVDSTTNSNVGAILGSVAAENWTGTAHGSAVGLLTTPIGTVDPQVNLAVLDSGFVAIGTPLDANGIPTATDRLQVFGDVRVGNSGTNGCVKNFAGTGLTGTCASDVRFKKDITPFGPALGAVAALQPVHYSWRTTEFPNRHFGTDRAYGLIAQEVEKVLPELVATDNDGYKAVDYGQLPLLTIQAVKELKTENDALKSRVVELERLVNELLAGTRR